MTGIPAVCREASRYRQVEKQQLRREAGPHLGEAEEEAEQGTCRVGYRKMPAIVGWGGRLLPEHSREGFCLAHQWT